MNRFIIFLLLILILSSVISAQDYFHGKLTGDTKWSGSIYLDGDVIVPVNVRLQIEPGTKIIIAPNKDAMRKGKDKNKIDIVIKGGFIAKGTPEARIVFTSESKEPMMADWYGINIKSKDNTCILDFVTIEYAYFGLNVVNSKPIIKNSEIRYNYMAGINVDLNGEPKIIGCAITANDYAGIKCDYGAKPIISECIISENSHGIIAFKKAEPNLGTVNRAGEAIGGNNRIFENWEYNIYNHTNSTIYAQNNNWLSTSFREIENKIYDKADEAKYGSVVYKPLFTEKIETIPVVALNEPAEQTLVQETASQPEEQVQVENQNDVAANTPVPQTATNIPVDVKTEDIAPAPVEKIEETKVENTPEQKEVTQPVNQEIEEKKVEVKKVLTAEEKIFEDIFSLKKTALEYQLDNKPIKRVKSVPTQYPPSYRVSRRAGRVFVRVVVDITGKVETANILKVEGGEEFAKSALDAVKQFEYEIGVLKGRAVRYVKNERFEFKQ